MAIAKEIDPPTSGISDWLLELVIGIAVLLLGGGVWIYMHFSSPQTDQERPKPVWLTVPRVMAQTADGRMVNVKVNLRLAKDKDASNLEPHIPAFKAMIQEASAGITRDELKDRDGILLFGKAVKASVNGYLKSQGVTPRIKDVVFDELMPLP